MQFLLPKSQFTAEGGRKARERSLHYIHDTNGVTQNNGNLRNVCIRCFILLIYNYGLLFPYCMYLQIQRADCTVSYLQEGSEAVFGRPVTEYVTVEGFFHANLNEIACSKPCHQFTGR